MTDYVMNAGQCQAAIAALAFAGSIRTTDNLGIWLNVDSSAVMRERDRVNVVLFGRTDADVCDYMSEEPTDAVTYDGSRVAWSMPEGFEVMFYPTGPA